MESFFLENILIFWTLVLYFRVIWIAELSSHAGVCSIFFCFSCFNKRMKTKQNAIHLYTFPLLFWYMKWIFISRYWISHASVPFYLSGNLDLLYSADGQWFIFILFSCIACSGLHLTDYCIRFLGHLLTEIRGTMLVGLI